MVKKDRVKKQSRLFFLEELSKTTNPKEIKSAASSTMPSATEEDISFMQGVESILKGTFGKDMHGSVSTTKKGSKVKETKNILDDKVQGFDNFLGTPRLGGKSEPNYRRNLTKFTLLVTTIRS